MRIGLIVDGQAEFRSLPLLVPRIQTKATILPPLFADIQPLAPKEQIVLAVKSRLSILAAKQADLVIVLLDLETLNVCPGAWAGELAKAVSQGCAGCGIVAFGVVIKNRCYENWLIGDPDVFSQIPKRFKFTPAHRKAIVPGRADTVDGLKILKAAALKTQYDKVNDAIRIMQHVDPRKVGANSRSFRRFLRLLGDPAYAAQSVKP